METGGRVARVLVAGGSHRIMGARPILTGSFSMPAQGATADVEVLGARGIKIGDTVWVESVGYCSVENIQK